MVLQHALASGNSTNVNAAIELLQEKGKEAALKANLENKTNNGFMVLQDALKSGNSANVTAVIQLLQKEGHEAALKANLSQVNGFGYNCQCTKRIQS
jgi:translation elongation factor EF-Ts